jgi:hypothetical protein
MLELFCLLARGKNGLLRSELLKDIWGHPSVFQLNDEGNHMPAFTFEKIAPPTNRGPVPKIEKKQRGVINQILDRFVEARVKRTADKVASTARREEPRRR